MLSAVAKGSKFKRRLSNPMNLVSLFPRFFLEVGLRGDLQWRFGLHLWSICCILR
jgi:hypothetical protein